MQGLLDTFKATKDDDSKDATAAGEKLAAQARRLEASDVVWQYLFQVPAAGDAPGRGPGRHHRARVGIRRERRAVHGALDDGDLAAHPRRLDRAVPRRVSTAPVLEKVVVQPAGTQLATDTETTIKASTDLAFDVSVKNTR